MLKEVLLEQIKKTKSNNLQVLVSSPLLEEDVIYSTTKDNQKFHSASVGKMMTAVCVIQLIEKGKLAWDSQIKDILDQSLLTNLFVYKNTDYANQVTIAQLLSHTSGVNDYFMGKYSRKESFLDRVIAKPDVFYHPKELVLFTQEHQKAVGIPGKKFLYSDTGYILLGLLIETITKKPYYQVLQEEICNPLSMKDTTLMFYDPNYSFEELAPVIAKGVDLREAKSLSIDFSGGGLSTTVQDLKAFLVGLTTEKLITKESLEKMKQFHSYFLAGMFYGYGLMELRFDKLFFLLRKYPKLIGHLGVLGVHAWIDPIHQDVYIINVGNISKMNTSFQLLIRLVGMLKKEREQK